ncbi:MAG: hypothetical protein JXB35_15725 [Anaerolineae bacterium]|nr:hypothetical protein [Anaerolineae bacterium]
MQETAALRSPTHPQTWRLWVLKQPVLWFCVALIVRLAAAVILHLYSVSAGYEGFIVEANADDQKYWQIATLLFNNRPAVWVPNIFPYVLVAVFKVFGFSLVSAKLLSIVFGSLVVYMSVKIGRLLLTSRPGPTAPEAREIRWRLNAIGLILTFYPTALYHSTQLSKEPLLVFLGLGAFYSALRFLTKPNAKAFSFLSVYLIFLYGFREYAAIIFVVCMAVFVLLYWNSGSARKIAYISSFLFAAAVVPYLLGYGWFATGYMIPLLRTDVISGWHQRSARGGSALDIVLDFNNPVQFAVNYVYSFCTHMFGPFPWQLRSATHFVALPEAVALWWLLRAWIKGVVSFFRFRARPGQLLLMFSIVYSGAIALFNGNLGTGMRLRMLSFSLFIIYALVNGPFLRLVGLKPPEAPS